MFTKILGIVAVSAVAGLGLAACDDNDNTSIDPLDTSLPTTSVAAPAPGLRLTNSSLGSIVTDSTGHTLYAFTNDKNGVSACYDACATAWPPALATNTTFDESITGTVGTTTRNDGSKQLTLNNWPLYRFAADGDVANSVKGQGNKGVWFVVDAAGKLVKTTPSTVGQSSSENVVPTPTTVKRTTTTTSSYKYDYGY